MAKIRVEDDGTGVHLLTLTDPERRNALGDEMGAAILSVLTRLRADSSVRVLVVTGEGTTFCAGADLP
jgi:enoyl-CoA hydratase